MEILLCQADGFRQPVRQDCRGSPADIHALKIISGIPDDCQLFPQGAEIRPGGAGLEDVAVEAAVGAKAFTEGDMDIQHILPGRIGFGQVLLAQMAL